MLVAAGMLIELLSEESTNAVQIVVPGSYDASVLPCVWSVSFVVQSGYDSSVII